MNVVVAATAIGKLHAEDIATAFRIFKLHHNKKGTVNVPPPIPNKVENIPIKIPEKIKPLVLGNVTILVGLTSNHICIATSISKIPKMIRNTSLDRESAINTPRQAPNKIPGAIRYTIDQDTACF